MRYWCTESDGVDIPEGMSAIIGIQEVVTDHKKIHIWMRQEVDRPIEIDRHRTTRRANNSHRRHDWGKSVWLKEEFFKHFGNALENAGVSKLRLDTFESDPDCDLWKTKNDGDRKFIKLLLINPISEITNQPLNIQVTQVSGKAPIEIYRRAYDESRQKLGTYKELVAKYKDKAMVKSYSKYLRENFVDTKLTPVYVKSGNEKHPIYETLEIVLGTPNHQFVIYEVFNSVPTDVLDFNEEETTTNISVTLSTSKVPIEKELTLDI